MKNIFFFSTFGYLIVLLKSEKSNLCTEKRAKSCGECISMFGCAWCEDPGYASNPNVPISRCNTPENLLSSKCPGMLIANPKSSYKIINETDLSEVGKAEIGLATQMKPQVFEVNLRPGDHIQLNFSYKQAEDYPVDLYYLLDLSKSMKNDLESLRALGLELGTKMTEISRDFKLGFGSFVDKTVMPYISTIPAKKDNPCSETEPCVPAYSFRNDLPLSSDITSFVRSVENVTHSGNLDFPEGGLDAMMQAIVCKEQIQWRTKATHLLVYSTDATFHYAGDGKLGGIVFPNNGQCYLNDDGKYTKANEMDYPSIGHLVRKITEHKIQPIFAVTEDVIQTYENLQKMIPKSAVGNLTSNSSNIIDLIQKAYNDLKGQIIIEARRTPKEVNITNKVSLCSDGRHENQFSCDGVKLGDVINFSFTLSTNLCFNESVLLQLQPYGYDEKLNITVKSKCSCDCSTSKEDVAAHNCSGNGRYECGSCLCDSGFAGLNCECNPKEDSPSILEKYVARCTAPGSDVPCNGRGECQCGVCICNQEENKVIDGDFCQCDNTTCPREKGNICNNQGECECGKCKCNDMWSGPACKCSLDKEPCIDRRNQANKSNIACSGQGECTCGSCVCDTSQVGIRYRGEFCQTKLFLCDVHKDCIQCKVFETGKYNSTEDCQSFCSNYSVTKLDVAVQSVENRTRCAYTDDTDNCNFVAFVVHEDEKILVDVNPEKNCASYINPIYIIVAIIAAIVGIGLALLLVWKLLTSIKDAREYKNFVEESQKARWQQGENPIYKKATSTFPNPMYTGGKPTANL